MISEDLDEILTLADRILVMYEGAIIGEVDPRTTTMETLGLMMAGVPTAPTGPTEPADGEVPATSSPLGE